MNRGSVTFMPRQLGTNLVCLAMCLTGWFVVSSSSAVFAAGSEAKTKTTEAANSELESTGNWAGIQGHYRPGQWTAIRLKHGESNANSATYTDAITIDRWEDVTIETVDGDGAIVTYAQPELSAESPFALAIPGSEAAPIVIRSGDEVLARTRLPEAGVPGNGASLIPLGMPWVMVFGDPLDIDTIGVNELLQREASVAVTRITEAAAVPNHSLALDGVELMVINASGIPVLNDLNESQRTALARWVQSGGQVLLTLGENARLLLESADWLAGLLPQAVADAETTKLDPSGLETFTSSQTRLPAFEGIQLPKTFGRNGSGQLLITGRTSRRVSQPFAVRYVSGFGKITVLAADLDAPEFADWPQRMDLVTLLVGDLLKHADEDDVSESIRLSGFADLAGQTRATLDRFELKRTFSFAVLAVIIGILIALVGPLDYLLMRKFNQKAWIGWLTFPAVSIALSIGLWMAAQPNVTANSSDLTEEESTADNLLRANTIEFVDIDGESGFGRCFQWSFVYSHPSNHLDIASEASTETSSVAQDVHHQVVAPFGTPSLAMGGIQIESSGRSCGVSLSGDSETLSSQIQNMRLAPRSSKSVALETQFTADLPTQSLKRRRGSELLNGQLTNTLPVDLLDGMLIYQNWVYLLPTRLPAGAQIDEVDSLRQKNFRWQLSRQRALESASEGESWDVTVVDQPRRLAEMLMFHDAVGGPRYTVLRNEVLRDLDFSSLLTEDRCILVGRCAQPWSELTITCAKDGDQSTSESTASQASLEQSNSFVRLILPVVEVRR
ncbi:hypothetical protein LOC71_02815 [Rhodopirellula sp. JC740]|uniref:Transmembrane protein n=1 Tax=Rhodopirellula halodulae TaxID=2894198 RepID=A0ABS8NCC4_9BACT|nr:hypothetical protein [Rhodopirellula sp. JC740]MCC9641190.1 hypothetical protein [Rhodopirellula sp. JC740]